MILAMRTRKATRQTEDADMFQEVQHEVTCIVLPVQVAGWAALDIRWHLDPLGKKLSTHSSYKDKTSSLSTTTRCFPYV